jgi:hypothetical protein
MRLRSPAERYIKYLLLHPDKHTDDDVKERLLDCNLDYIGKDYIERVRKKLKPPASFYPFNEQHAPSRHFLMDEGLYRLFHRQMPMKIALNILDHARAKEFVEAMILCQVPLQSIANFLRFQWRIPCSVDALSDYQHCFWDIDKLDASSMRVLLQLRVEVLAEDLKEFKDRKSLLKNAYYKDARVEAADLPVSMASALLVQSRMGFSSKHFDVGTGATEARKEAVKKALESVLRDGPNDHMKFVNFVNGARMLSEMIELVIKPGDQMHEELRALSIKTETTEVIEAHQLTGGNHTVDLEPKDNHEQPDEPGQVGNADAGRPAT